MQDTDQKSLQDFTDIFNSQTVIDGKAILLIVNHHVQNPLL